MKLQRLQAAIASLAILLTGTATAAESRDAAPQAAESSAIQTVNLAQLQAAIASEGAPVVVLFHAEWAAPSKALKRSLAEAAPSYGSKLRFMVIDVDSDPEVAKTYGLRGLPTLKMFSAGKELRSSVGIMVAPQLSAWLSSALSAATDTSR